MRLWPAFVILFLLTCHVESHEKRSPNKRIPGKMTTSTPYSVTTEDPGCICITLFDPVCGSDGVTYGNRCELMCAQRQNPDLKEAHTGPCQPTCPPPPEGSPTESCVCTEEFKPVCGSDGITYGNFCIFCCEQRKNPSLTFAHDGMC